MQGNTKRRWRQALVSAVISALFQVGTAAFLLWLRSTVASGGFLSALLLALALADLLFLIPLGIILRQRYFELLGGEEDAACQY